LAQAGFFSYLTRRHSKLPNMHRVLLFGATGGTGAEVLKQLKQPSTANVTCFVRSPDKLIKLGLQPDTAVQGDVRDAVAVKSAVSAGFDSIIISLGSSGIWYPDDTCSVGTKNILAALQGSSSRPKLVVCSSMGVRERSAIPGFVQWLLKHPLADKDVQEADVEASGLPFVIVRPTGLRNTPALGLSSVAIVRSGPTPTSRIARADVAAFLIAQMRSEEHTNKCVGISNAS
jgi:uncharacterized protein YbjT (DUF2867 family)